MASNIFIFTAGDSSAREHLNDSIKNPITLSEIENQFKSEEQSEINSIDKAHGLYAWGAMPGSRNIPQWKAMEKGDWVLCVYDSTYHFVAQVVTKFDNKAAAEKIWGSDDKGNTWQYMYFLTPPIKVDVPLSEVSDYLNERYMGFTKISTAKLENIADEFGSVDDFINDQFTNEDDEESKNYSSWIFQFNPEIYDGRKAIDELSRIHWNINQHKNDIKKGDLVYIWESGKNSGVVGFFRVMNDPKMEKDSQEEEKYYLDRDALGSEKLRVQLKRWFKLSYDIPKSKITSNEYLKEISIFRASQGTNFPLTPSEAEVLLKIVLRTKPNNEPAREAYDALIAHGETQKGFAFAPEKHGYMIDIAYRTDRKKICSFVVNKKDILFYLRRNAGKTPDEELAKVMAAGFEAELNPSRRGVKIRIGKKLEAQRLINFVFGDGEDSELENFLLIRSNKKSDYADELGKVYAFTNKVPNHKKLMAPSRVIVERKTPHGVVILGHGVLSTPTEVGETTNGVTNFEAKFKEWVPVADPVSLSLDVLAKIKSLQGYNVQHAIKRLDEGTYHMILEEVSGGARSALKYSLEDALMELFMSEDDLRRIIGSLRHKGNIILQGPPGVGKTFAAQRIGYALIGERASDRVGMVQFHQSYAYEDFIQGWRPNSEGGFQLQDGVFFEFCEKARSNPAKDFVFVIDEINRGNLSKVFGELMMLIESDKRSIEYAMPLTYSRSPFFVPPNVKLIGLMNTADRSLAMVDYALRRRFQFFTLNPQFESESFVKWLGNKGISAPLIEKIQTKMNLINSNIISDTHLGKGFQVGHSFFCNPSMDIDERDWYQNVIHSEIAPLIEEYWADDSDKSLSLVEDLLA